MIERYFTKEIDSRCDNVYDCFKWKKVDVEIKDWQTGEVIYKGHDLEFPEHYSQQACEIIASKYFYRNIDGKGTTETSLRQVVHRMARFWTEALIDEGLLEGNWVFKDNYFNYRFNDIENECLNWFNPDGTASIFYDEIVYTLLNQMWAPNSPQWFNTGIKYYGIKGDPDDMYWYDEEGLHKSEDRYTRSQTSACFIIPISDHLIGKDSITDHYITETKLFKGGSGVGTNFSPLRAEGEALSSGGKSSGVMSFLLGLDRNAGAIKSGGTTRRAAKMVILDIDHPDIEDFIDWKVHEEKKARDLMGLGYDGSLNGEAYLTVSGQNSNNSVRVNKEFMDKVLNNDPDPNFELKGRKDQSLNRTVNVHDLWDKIAKAAWECADPGIQFDDKYNEWNTAANDGRINATNPCSEYAFLDNSACNLASINVEKFYDIQTDDYDYNSFCKLVELIQFVLEASIYWGQFPTEDVAENSYKYRATGLGLCNLGSLFLEMKYPYDSDYARSWASDLASLMTAHSYLTSTKISKKIGPCEGYSNNADQVYKVIDKHCQAVVDNGASPFALSDFQDVLDNLDAGTGIRNMQVTVMAPTGTISLAMDCAATGIEPFFSHRMYKKCSDGSMLEMINPLVDDYFKEICVYGYQRASVDQYFDEHGTYQGCEDLTEEAQKVLETANEISPEAHVKMMAAIQPFISGSISKTVNLPNSATVEDIKDIYELAYLLDCKSISIYRDGSKGTQPLNVSLDEEQEEVNEPDEAEEPDKVEEQEEVEEPEKDSFETRDLRPRFTIDKTRDKKLYEKITKLLYSPEEEPKEAEEPEKDSFEFNDSHPRFIIDKNQDKELYEKVTKQIYSHEEEPKEVEEPDKVEEQEEVNEESKDNEDEKVTMILKGYGESGSDEFWEKMKEQDTIGLTDYIENLETSVHTTITKYDDYFDCLEKEEFKDAELLVKVSDNQNIDIQTSQEYIDISSNKPIDITVQEPNTEEFERYQHIAVPEELIYRTERTKPESIRRGTTHTAKIGNVELYVTVSYYDNGKLCEIFVSSDKEGTTIKGLLSSLSKSISHMLQYGIEPEKIAQMLRNQQYEPAGHVERHKYIKMCTSISDFIARVIEYECGDYTRCQVKPIKSVQDEKFKKALKDPFKAPPESEDVKAFREEIEREDLGNQPNYTGSECSICHSKRMIKNGTCELCLDCGSTSGCS